MKQYWALILVLISTSVFANTDEDKILDEITQTLEKLKQEVVKAKQHQSLNKRIKVQYQHIYQDLSKVQAGIVATRSEFVQEPRVIQPIKGDYLETSGGSRDA